MSSAVASLRILQTSQIIRVLCGLPGAIGTSDLLTQLESRFPGTEWDIDLLLALLEAGAREGRFIERSEDAALGGDDPLERTWQFNRRMISENSGKNTSLESMCDRTVPSLVQLATVSKNLQLIASSDLFLVLLLNENALDQVRNMDGLTISAEQWEILSAMDQSLSTTSDVTFNSLTTSNLVFDELKGNDTDGIAVTSISGGGTHELSTAGLVIVEDFEDTTLVLPDLSVAENRKKSFQIVSRGLIGGTFDGQVIFNAFAHDDEFLYVGGNFTAYGSNSDVLRNRLLRIVLANGALDSDWNPDCSGDVYAIAADTVNNLLYIGGLFTTVGGVSRNRIARIPLGDSNPTGVVDSWDPNSDGQVRTIDVDTTAGLVYAGGAFTNIGGLARNRIARLSASTGAADATWDPNADNNVFNIRLDTANSVAYVGGQFANIGGAARNRIARIEFVGAAADSWDPNANNTVYFFFLAGSNVYVTGQFSNIGGQSRVGAARLSVSTGSADSWNAELDSTAYSIDVTDDHVTLGGSFFGSHGEFRPSLARVNTTDGALDDYNPVAANPAGGGDVNALLRVSSTNALYCGGRFSELGGWSFDLNITKSAPIRAFAQLTTVFIETANSEQLIDAELQSTQLVSPVQIVTVMPVTTNTWSVTYSFNNLNFVKT